MSSESKPALPIITLTTDFGLDDFYVAEMKAVLLRQCPTARLIDITHGIPRHDILCGSIALERAINSFPEGTIHLAVVDPGVGTSRRLLVSQINGQWIVCPDNGLITWAWHRHGPGQARELTWRPAKQSNTFHGRDIMAPVAAMLACGEDAAVLSRPIEDPVFLKIAPVAKGSRTGQIIHIDQFGNAMTNVPEDVLSARDRPPIIRVRNCDVGLMRKTYGDVTSGELLALIGSSGLLEIAVREGSAKDELGLQVGDVVILQ